MNRLLNLNFHRLLKSLLFKISIVFSVLYAVFLNFTRFLNISMIPDISSTLLNNNGNNADCFTFSGAPILIFVASLVTASFIGSEYSEGTIRNLFIAGHSRKEVYLSNFVVCAAASCIILMAYILSSLVSGLILLEKPCLGTDRLIISILSQCLYIAGFSAFLVFVSMLIQSKSASIAVLLISTGIMLGTAMSITTTLNEPEHFINHAVIYTEDETGEEKYGTFEQENPRFVSGIKRKVLEQLNNTLPVNQIYRVYLNVPALNSENFGTMAIYSIIIDIAVNITGISIFKKRDLK